jgi:hypothetical protein
MVWPSTPRLLMNAPKIAEWRVPCMVCYFSMRGTRFRWPQG